MELSGPMKLSGLIQAMKNILTLWGDVDVEVLKPNKPKGLYIVQFPLPEDQIKILPEKTREN